MNLLRFIRRQRAPKPVPDSDISSYTVSRHMATFFVQHLPVVDYDRSKGLKLQVRFRPEEPAGGWQLINYDLASREKVYIRGLDTGRTYLVQVRMVDDAGQLGRWSSACKITVPSGPVWVN